jgi:hypothetical protein
MKNARNKNWFSFGEIVFNNWPALTSFPGLGGDCSSIDIVPVNCRSFKIDIADDNDERGYAVP